MWSCEMEPARLYVVDDLEATSPIPLGYFHDMARGILKLGPLPHRGRLYALSRIHGSRNVEAHSKRPSTFGDLLRS